jgi:protein-disulfide isomerase
VTEHDHVRGPAQAPVTLVEYGDFQCPFCGQAYWVLESLEQRFRRDLRFVFRHFPMPEIHPYALVAAKTAEDAAAEGRFWDMHGLLFRNQEHLAPPWLVRYGQQLDLDLDELSATLETERYDDRIRSDFMGGVRSGVNGTPCLFINGQRFNGPVDFQPLATVIETMIDEARRTAAAHR